MNKIIKEGEVYIVTEDITVFDVTVPAGFKCDGASIPKTLKPIFKHEEDEYLIPAILHDYMYSQNMGFLKANNYFYRTMKLYKVNPVTRALFYSAVTTFGYSHYKK